MKTIRQMKKGAVAAPLSMALMGMLSACGGGGGGGAADPVPLAVQVSLAGAAGVGLLKHAAVVVSTVGADGALTPVDSTETAEDGRYQMAGLPSGALVVVEVTPKTDALGQVTTRMVDPVTNTDMAAPKDLHLRAALVLQGTVPNSSNIANVTPFSAMAVSMAEAAGPDGKLAAQAVAGANAQMSRYLQLDALSNAPSFTSDKTPDGQNIDQAKPGNPTAVWLSAIAQLSNDPQALAVLGCPAGEPPAALDCVVKAMVNAGAGSTVLAGLLEEAKTAVVAAEAYDATTHGNVASVAVQTELLPEQLSGIAAAKELFASLRANEAPLKRLGTELRSVAGTLKDIGNPLSGSQQTLLQALAQSVVQLDGYARGANQGPLPVAANDLFRPDLGDASAFAGCTLYRDAAFDAVATTYGNADFMACRVTYAAVSGPDATTTRYQHQFFISPNTASATGAYEVRTRIVEAKVDGAGRLVGQVVVEGSTKVATITLQPKPSVQSAEDYRGLAMSGTLAPQVFAPGQYGNAGIGVDVLAGLAPVGANTKMNLVGYFTRQDASGAVLASIGVKAGSYVMAKTSTPGEVDGEIIDNSASEGYFVLEATSGTARLNGILKVWGFQRSKVGDDEPSRLDFTGQVQSGATRLFDGRLDVQALNWVDFDKTAPASAANFLATSTAVQGTLYLPTGSGQQTTPRDVNLTFTENPFGAYAIAGSLEKWMEGRVTGKLLLSATASAGQNDAVLTIASDTGIQVTLPQDFNEADVIANGGVVIGRLDRARGLITYADHSFESF